jgi:hypothetical protein
LRYVASETPTPGDDAFAVAGEQFGVHPGLVVVAVEISHRGQLHEVLVAGVVHRQQRAVVANVVAPRRAVVARPRGDVRLDADDRLDSGLTSRPVEVDDAVEDAVIGDGEGGLAVEGCSVDDVAHARRPVEHRELGVDVQMCEAVAGQRILHEGTTPM